MIRPRARTAAWGTVPSAAVRLRAPLPANCKRSPAAQTGRRGLMRLSWNEVRTSAAAFADEWRDAVYEKGGTQSFLQRRLRRVRSAATGSRAGPVSNRSTASGAFHAYRRAISETLATGQATEHSYRPALQALVAGLRGDAVRAVNEPSHVVCGAPDFVVVRGGVPMGHIECKDVSAHLDRVEDGEQLTRYRTGHSA